MKIVISDEEIEAKQENNFIKKRQRTDIAINLIKKTRLTYKKLKNL